MRLYLSAVVVCSLAAASPASAQPHDRFYTFGDSLADNGNVLAATLQTPVPLPPPGAYCQGRFSNGPVSFEFVWAGLQGVPLAPACPVAAGPGALQPVLLGGVGPAVNFA